MLIDEFGDDLSERSGLSGFEDHMIAGWLKRRREQARPGKPATFSQLEDIADAAVLLELSDGFSQTWADFDPPDALVVNPAEIRLLEEDKLAFSSLCWAIGADRYRPRSSHIYTHLPGMRSQGDLREATDVEDVVLKFPEVDAGQGVTVMKRQELTALTDLADRIGTWGSMLSQLSGRGFSLNVLGRMFNGDMPSQLLVEEYVPSKPIKAPDGRHFDATMRVVISSLANQGKVTVVPMAAYWKLPEAPLGSKRLNRYNNHQISRVKEGGSLPVSEPDFQRAFRDVADFMKRLLHHTRSSNPKVNYWPRQGTEEL
jgi:hypothetical protein